MKSLDPQVVAAALPAVIHVLLKVIHAWDAEKRVGRGRRSDRPGSLPGGFPALTSTAGKVSFLDG